MADENEKFGVKNPNEGVEGKVASNMTGEAITPQYDYGNITDSDKIVVNEIINFLRARDGIPAEMLVEELKVKFNLVEIPMRKIEDSVWGQLTKDERIGSMVQGFRESTNEKGEKERIPHVGFSADLDYLDGFVNRLYDRMDKIRKG